MSTNDIFNIYEKIKLFLHDKNKEDLNMIANEFKNGHYLNVLSKIKSFRENHDVSKNLDRTLLLLEASSYTQINEKKKAEEIINTLYQDSCNQSIDDLMLLGNLAFMCDFKLSRRILSETIKKIENEDPIQPLKAAHVYHVLGEIEENLKKFVRAIKYYKRAITYFNLEKEKDRQIILFLHYKLGGLHSLMNQLDDAIDHLQKTLELSEADQIDIRVNCLVSMGKIYGRKNDYEVANAYIKKAIPMFKVSSLENKLVHAEAHTELAYNLFAQSKFEEAVPHYEKAIDLYPRQQAFSSRDLGMTYMQYAYCLEQLLDIPKAERNYEKAINQLEKTEDPYLLEDALGDVITFFERTGNKRKQKLYENKWMKLTNEQIQIR